MTHRTRSATKASSDVRFWFLLVDLNFTSASRPKDVNVPSDGVVEDFQKMVIASGWKQFENVAHTDLIVWKLPTPQPPREARKPTYLASVKPKGEILEEEVKMEEEMVGKGKGKAKAKAKQEVKTVSQLFPGDKISSYLMESTASYNISVLVQVAAEAEGTSCCAVSTRYQLIQLRMSSKHKLQPLCHLNVMVQRRHYHSAIFVILLLSPPLRH